MNITDTERLNCFERNEYNFKFCRHPTMCGTYPCWVVRLRSGNTKFKNLRDAIDAMFLSEKSINPET